MYSELFLQEKEVAYTMTNIFQCGHINITSLLVIWILNTYSTEYIKTRRQVPEILSGILLYWTCDNNWERRKSRIKITILMKQNVSRQQMQQKRENMHFIILHAWMPTCACFDFPPLKKIPND